MTLTLPRLTRVSSSMHLTVFASDLRRGAALKYNKRLYGKDFCTYDCCKFSSYICDPKLQHSDGLVRAHVMRGRGTVRGGQCTGRKMSGLI